MRLLVDTHIAIWAIDGDKRLPRGAIDLLRDPQNDLYASVVSLWEIGVKHAQPKRADPIRHSAESALALFERGGFKMLPLTTQHVIAVDRLPPLHKDPFDRLLIAQAVTEPMRLLTHDRQLAPYGDNIIMV